VPLIVTVCCVTASDVSAEADPGAGDGDGDDEGAAAPMSALKLSTATKRFLTFMVRNCARPARNLLRERDACKGQIYGRASRLCVPDEAMQASTAIGALSGVISASSAATSFGTVSTVT
jgi:hypothetical protein